MGHWAYYGLAACSRESDDWLNCRTTLTRAPHQSSPAAAPDAFWRKLRVGASLDARDTSRGHWHKAKISAVDDELGRVKVHYQGWASKWDE